MSANKLCGIYLVTCVPNGRRYVGQSTNIYSRWRGHLCSMRNRHGKNTLMENCFHKYGEDSFVFEILELCDEDELVRCEEHWISKLHTRVREGGFNLREPTYNPNSVAPVSQHTKDKMSYSSSHKFTAFGKTLTLTEWQNETGINRDAIRARIKRGLSIEEALKKKCQKGKIYQVLGTSGRITELCRLHQIPVPRTKSRLALGWCPTKAFLLPHTQR